MNLFMFPFHLFFLLTGMETAMGVVDVKSWPVYFHVQKNQTYTLVGTTIPFQIERLNVGGGMNISSGIFLNQEFTFSLSLA